MQARIQIGLLLITLALVALGVTIPSTLLDVEYAIQAVVLISTLVVPMVGSSLRASFWTPVAICLIWGAWRMTYFDPAVKNDIVELGYLITPLQFGLIALTIYAIRKAMISFRKREN